MHPRELVKCNSGENKRNTRRMLFIVSDFIWAPSPAFLSVYGQLKRDSPLPSVFGRSLCNHWRGWVRLLPVCFGDRWWATGRAISRRHNRRLNQACDVTWQRYYQLWQLQLVCLSVKKQQQQQWQWIPIQMNRMVHFYWDPLSLLWSVLDVYVGCREAVTLPKVTTPRWARTVVCEANECCITEHRSLHYITGMATI